MNRVSSTTTNDTRIFEWLLNHAVEEPFGVMYHVAPNVRTHLRYDLRLIDRYLHVEPFHSQIQELMLRDMLPATNVATRDIDRVDRALEIYGRLRSDHPIENNFYWVASIMSTSKLWDRPVDPTVPKQYNLERYMVSRSDQAFQCVPDLSPASNTTISIVELWQQRNRDTRCYRLYLSVLTDPNRYKETTKCLNGETIPIRSYLSVMSSYMVAPEKWLDYIIHRRATRNPFLQMMGLPLPATETGHPFTPLGMDPIFTRHLTPAIITRITCCLRKYRLVQ
jgi:hypothetical protein